MCISGEKYSFEKLKELQNIVVQDSKYVAVVSTDVERCFSAYKNMLSDKTKYFPSVTCKCLLLCTTTIVRTNLTKSRISC